MTNRYGDLHTTKTWRQIEQELRDEFRKWDIHDYLLPFQDDSVRRGSVTVTVYLEGEERRLACGRFTERNAPERNYCAILLAVKSARLAEQRGIGFLVAEAAKLKQLPDPNDPHFILGVQPSAGFGEVKAAYKRRIVQAHPDQGGNRADLERVMDAGRKLGVA